MKEKHVADVAQKESKRVKHEATELKLLKKKRREPVRVKIQQNADQTSQKILKDRKRNAAKHTREK